MYMSIFTLVIWKKNQSNSVVVVRGFTPKAAALAVISITAAGFVAGLLVGLILTQQLSFMDSTSTMLNLAGIILFSLRYQEALIMWLVRNLVDIILFSILIAAGTGVNAEMLIVTAALYIVCNSIRLRAFKTIKKLQQM
jgi:nicotinamide riboside transporter PnuC